MVYADVITKFPGIDSFSLFLLGMGLRCGGFVKRIIIIGIYKVNLEKLTLYFVYAIRLSKRT